MTKFLCTFEEAEFLVIQSRFATGSLDVASLAFGGVLRR